MKLYFYLEEVRSSNFFCHSGYGNQCVFSQGRWLSRYSTARKNPLITNQSSNLCDDGGISEKKGDNFPYGATTFSPFFTKRDISLR